jgi:hypothetical protein
MSLTLTSPLALSPKPNAFLVYHHPLASSVLSLLGQAPPGEAPVPTHRTAGDSAVRATTNRGRPQNALLVKAPRGEPSVDSAVHLKLDARAAHVGGQAPDHLCLLTRSVRRPAGENLFVFNTSLITAPGHSCQRPADPQAGWRADRGPKTARGDWVTLDLAKFS